MDDEKIECLPEAMEGMRELAEHPERFRSPPDPAITVSREMAERLATLDLSPPPMPNSLRDAPGDVGEGEGG